MTLPIFTDFEKITPKEVCFMTEERLVKTFVLSISWFCSILTFLLIQVTFAFYLLLCQDLSQDVLQCHLYCTISKFFSILRSSPPKIILFKCRSVVSIKLLCKFIEPNLRHGYSPVNLPLNLPHILWTHIPRNTSGGLLLLNIWENQSWMDQVKFFKGCLPKNLLRSFLNTWTHLYLFSCLRPATLLKKRLWHRCFPVNFTKFLRTHLLKERLWWLLLSCTLSKIARRWTSVTISKEIFFSDFYYIQHNLQQLS